MYSVSWEFSELDTSNKIFYGCVANVSFSISSTGAGNKEISQCRGILCFLPLKHELWRAFTFEKHEVADIVRFGFNSLKNHTNLLDYANCDGKGVPIVASFLIIESDKHI
jgi:hypothetical protein